MSGIGILDPGSGETFKLHTKPPFDLHSPVFLGPRPRPPVVRELIDAESEDAADATGFLIAQNVFYTRQTNAALARVRAVRVMEGRPFTLRSARHQYDHLGVEAIELGTVPLAPDGSFHVEVPADRALALQAVDAEGRSVVNELSWIYVRPGERRACVGCHSPREGAPPNTRGVLALRAEPVRLLGQGRPLRFRGNNAANGGVLNLQFDRFREVAAIDLHDQPAARNGDAARKGAITPEVPALLELLRTGEAALKISSAQRLAVFRHRAAAAGLAAALRDESALVRLNAALALAACGTRESVPPLLAALDDADGVAAQAADLALRNLSGHTVEFNAFAPSADRERGAARWRAWFKTNDWPVIERALIARLRAGDAATTEDAINALGHVGGDAARDALRDLVARDFGENLRVNLAALRALGHLQDPRANELLVRVLNENIPPRAEKSRGLHEYGWIQAPVHRAGAAAEALGRIGTAQAEAALVEAFTRLEYFTNYTYRSGDHEWLVGCHASIPHFRLAAALDALGTRVPPELVPTLLRSVPIDTDRALLFENDSYEAVTGRLVNRSGVAAQVIENCLSALGDEQAKASPELRDAVTNSPPAKSVGPLDPPARAAQLLAVVGAAAECAPRVRAALDRFRAQPPSRARSWTCFYLARALGRWRDAGSVDSLLAVLEQDPTEASFGLTDPPNVFLNHAMTPCHRAAAAYALGEIGERRATGPLLAAVSNFDNAMDVRHAAARALGRLADAKCLPALRQLAVEYPETATRRVLLAACAALAPPEKTEGRLARKKEGH
jgi:HEAT repeat protein